MKAVCAERSLLKFRQVISLESKSLFATMAFVFITLWISGQSNSSLDLRSSIGFLVPHSESMKHLANEHSRVIAFGYSQESSGSKYWHKKLNNPRQGLAVYLMDVGSEEEIGKVIATYGYLDFKLWGKSRLSQSFRFGSGISYVQKSFDRLENNRNVAIGSKMNLGFLFATSWDYELDKFKVGAGISLTHASSGAFKLPNLGINIPAIDLKISYKLANKEKEALPESKDITNKISQWDLDVILSSGPRAVDVVTTNKYFIHTLQMELARRNESILSYGLGVDYFYNSAIGYLDGDLGSLSPISQIGGKAGINLILDRASLFLQLGTYLHNDSKFQGNVYNRFGGRYHLKNKFIFNFSLKTHGARADNFEAGFGYRFL